MRDMNKKLRRELGEKRARRILKIRKAMAHYHPEWFSEDGKFYKKLINTRVPCSCAFCGNPRKYFGEITLQERKSYLDYLDNLDLT